ncbi:FadR/GntR family transcriptional regulator [Nocardia sp. CA-128927]|uniref:FadR/GntR family transcriptional regulator n=1 Tax=Nocardia sp. CA-128927 TaxID=3239975 RepID=UPI003D98015C
MTTASWAGRATPPARSSANTQVAQPRPEAWKNPGVATPTVVDDITEQLAYRIAAGSYQPGELLPSVRQVAAEFGVSTPTANSALGRLAALGFVEARRGLGYLVRDIQLYGGIDTWRFMFRFAHRVPDRAAKIFADIIDVDHMLVMEAIRAVAREPRRYDMSRAVHALDRLELLVGDDKSGLTDIMAAELHMLRCMFAALGKPGYLSLFNTVGQMLISIPEAGQAFYDPVEPAGHVVLCRNLLEIWAAKTDIDLPEIGMIETLVREYHDQVVQTFSELIGAKPVADPAE